MSSSNPPSPVSLPARLPALDGLRAIAILLVVPHNLNLMVTSGGIAHVFIAALYRGWIGVQLFFVLSGFLITGILLDARNAPDYYRSFFVRRVLRIFPLYYATLVVLLVLLPALGLLPASFKRDPLVELSLWAYYSNWYGAFHQGPDAVSHFWSLAVEEQFYCFVPAAWMAERGLAPADLVRPDREGVAAIAARLEGLARAALARVPDYLALIPARHVRFRLFCLWPALWAKASLRHARRDAEFPWGARRPRLPRAELWGAALRSLLVAPHEGAVRRLYARLG